MSQRIKLKFYPSNETMADLVALFYQNKASISKWRLLKTENITS